MNSASRTSVAKKFRETTQLAPPSVRTSRIDVHIRALNPRRKQQLHCFTLPPASVAILETAEISTSLRNALYRTLHFFGCFLFSKRLGSICARKDLVAHLSQHLSRDTARRHLRLMDDMGLIVQPRNYLGSVRCVSFEHYTEANPTAAEASARYQARLTQLRSAQARFRARKRVRQTTNRKQIAPQLHKLTQFVITLKRRQQEKHGRPFYRSFSGHLRRLLPYAEVNAAVLQVEESLFAVTPIAKCPFFNTGPS